MSNTAASSFVGNLEKNPIKIEKWNIQDVKVTFDDLIVKFMNEELKWKEDRFLLMLKVGVYFLLNVIGVATGLYTYLVKPFEATRLLTGVGAAIYLLGMGAFHLCLQHYITPTVYRGQRGGKAVWMCSKMLYPQGIYVITATRPASAQKLFTFEVSVGAWLTEEGEVVPERVHQDLKSGLKLE